MRHRARVALYNSLFARSIVALCSGVGGKIPPWGEGLSLKNFVNNNMKIRVTKKSYGQNIYIVK